MYTVSRIEKYRGQEHARARTRLLSLFYFRNRLHRERRYQCSTISKSLNYGPMKHHVDFEPEIRFRGVGEINDDDEEVNRALRKKKPSAAFALLDIQTYEISRVAFIIYKNVISIKGLDNRYCTSINFNRE